MKRLWLIIIGVVLGVAVVGGGVFYSVATSTVPTEDAVKPLPKDTIDPAAFKENYPLHYESYLKNAQNLPVALKYHAAEPKNSRLDKNDWMKTLWAGYAFSKEYNEARGHAYVLEDTIGATKTARINEKTNLTCMYCKSAEVPGLIEKMGNAFYNTKLLADNNKDLFKHPISCSDCHNPETMALRVTRPAFTEAMARRGVDVAAASREDMRSYVCAQCHVTYFFNPNDSNRVWFPWDKGFDAKNMYDFETNDIKLSEWTHPQTGQGMIKARHPEFEMWQGSTHQQNGVSCADCHMPYMKEGEAKITSHWWTSPMRTYEQSCGQCHKQTEEQMRQQVITIQDRNKEATDKAGIANKAAILAIEKAKNTAGVDTKLLDEAKAMQREAQFYWDLVSSENSNGAHNPSKMLKTLADSIDLARQAEAKAIQAAAAAPALTK